METKTKVILGGVGAVIAVLVGFTDLTDKLLSIFQKQSDHAESSTICSKGESIIVKTDSQAGQLIGKKLKESLSPRCRVYPPSAPSNSAEKLTANEIKYYHGQDAAKAEDLAQRVLKCCQIVAKLKYLPEFAKRDSKRYHVGYFEVWLR